MFLELLISLLFHSRATRAEEFALLSIVVFSIGALLLFFPSSQK